MTEEAKDKFKTETHRTRCGDPWREIKLKGNSYETTVIAVDIGGYEIIVFIGGSGGADGHDGKEHKHDLIPIKTQKALLPLGLRPEIEWMAMDKDCKWHGFAERPVIINGAVDWCDGDYPTNKDYYWKLDCLDIQEDPAGWRSSPHRRVNIGQSRERWERCK